MIVLVLALLGLALGSFVNALVWRLHKQSEDPSLSFPRKRESSKNKNSFTDWIPGQARNDRPHAQRYSILNGRSMCPHCEHELSAKELVPVFSWLWLRGKCRNCKKPISWQYPLVELAVAAAFVLSYLVWPQPLETWLQWVDFGLWLAGLVGLSALFIYDLKWSLLPDKIVWPLVGLAVVDVAVQVAGQTQGSFPETLQFYLFGLAPITGVYLLIYMFSNGRMVGFGDVKLGAFMGLSLGWPGAVLVLFLANTLGALVVLPGMLAGRLTRTSRVPFGPFLIVAYVIAGLWGGRIIDWYLGSLPT